MAAMTIDLVLARINSICAGRPFELTPGPTPFDFDTVPTGEIDGAFRVEMVPVGVIGGMSFHETRQDEVRVWVARKALANPHETVRLLQLDASSLTAAIVRDGSTGGGDYDVLDRGRGASISHHRGQEYATLRLTLTVDYEAAL